MVDLSLHRQNLVRLAIDADALAEQQGRLITQLREAHGKGAKLACWPDSDESGPIIMVIREHVRRLDMLKRHAKTMRAVAERLPEVSSQKRARISK